MQVDAFALIQAATDNAAAKLASIEAKRNYLARLYRPQRRHARRRRHPPRARRHDCRRERRHARPLVRRIGIHAFTTTFSARLGRAGERCRESTGVPKPRQSPRRRPIPRRPCSLPSLRQNGQDYQPVVTLNGWTLPWRMNGDWKEFHLVAEPVEREFAPGMTAKLWGYNGQTPGPDHRGGRGRQGAHLRHQQAARAHHRSLARPDLAERHGWRRRPHPAAYPSRQDLRLRVRAARAAAASCTTRIRTRWCRWRWA